MPPTADVQPPQSWRPREAFPDEVVYRSSEYVPVVTHPYPDPESVPPVAAKRTISSEVHMCAVGLAQEASQICLVAA